MYYKLDSFSALKVNNSMLGYTDVYMTKYPVNIRLQKYTIVLFYYCQTIVRAGLESSTDQTPFRVC